MDILLPAIRHACQGTADDIAYAKMEAYDAYTITFRPKIRAFVTVTGPYVYGVEPHAAVREIVNQILKVIADCEFAINEPEEPPEDIVIEFSLGAQPPQPTL